jgi:hypothetical protein
LDGGDIDEKLLAFFRSIGENITNSLSTEELLTIHSLHHGQKLAAGLERRLPRLIELGIAEHDACSGYSLLYGK